MLKSKSAGSASTGGGMEWCSRVLVASPIHYGLCTSELTFRRELKRLGLHDPPDWPDESSEAEMMEFETEGGGSVIIVCVPPNKNMDDLTATLVHEAVHIWQRIKEYIAEKEPSPEFEAYSIESIFKSLRAAYVAQRGKKSGTVSKRKQH